MPNNEPVIIRTLVGATLGLLVAFGVKLSGAQSEAVLTFTDALIQALPLITGMIGAWSARGKVAGPQTIAEAVRLIEAGKAKDALMVLAPSKPQPSRGFARLSLMAALSMVTLVGSSVAMLTTGCASAAAWLPAVTAGLQVVSETLTQLDNWVAPYRSVAQLSGFFGRYDALMAEARATVTQAQRVAVSGKNAEAEARQLGNQARALVQKVLDLLGEFGMFAQNQLKEPPVSFSRADGSAAEPRAPQRVELPPEL